MSNPAPVAPANVAAPAAPAPAAPVEEAVPTRGAELLASFNEMSESIQTDIVKFFDKGQKAAAKRCRVTSSAMIHFLRELRKEIQEEKKARLAEKKAAQ